ncbi:MAG: hypothetical protein HY352_00165 [Candidatus Omnitrophica bacterium]|nr:hypothetical protein [Candidatus Omnitrophota bacterium]
MGSSPGAYRSAKRGKELARRKKQEEKRQRRLARAAGGTAPEGSLPTLDHPEPPTASAPDAGTPSPS